MVLHFQMMFMFMSRYFNMIFTFCVTLNSYIVHTILSYNFGGLWVTLQLTARAPSYTCACCLRWHFRTTLAEDRERSAHFNREAPNCVWWHALGSSQIGHQRGNHFLAGRNHATIVRRSSGLGHSPTFAPADVLNELLEMFIREAKLVVKLCDIESTAAPLVKAHQVLQALIRNIAILDDTLIKAGPIA